MHSSSDMMEVSGGVKVRSCCIRLLAICKRDVDAAPSKFVLGTTALPLDGANAAMAGIVTARVASEVFMVIALTTAWNCCCCVGRRCVVSVVLCAWRWRGF